MSVAIFYALCTSFLKRITKFSCVNVTVILRGSGLGIWILFFVYLHFIYRWQYIKTHALKVQLNCIEVQKNWHHLILSMHLVLSSIFSILSWILTLKPVIDIFGVSCRKKWGISQVIIFMANAKNFSYNSLRHVLINFKHFSRKYL